MAANDQKGTKPKTQDKVDKYVHDFKFPLELHDHHKQTPKSKLLVRIGGAKTAIPMQVSAIQALAKGTTEKTISDPQKTKKPKVGVFSRKQAIGLFKNKLDQGENEQRFVVLDAMRQAVVAE